jgi:hypothetical protein
MTIQIPDLNKTLFRMPVPASDRGSRNILCRCPDFLQKIVCFCQEKVLPLPDFF